ncbi:MAG: hypothetical protein GTO14_21720 [Anaerolineales bacterium]|nr:hypothetical protein [Anaerolineales bacterium]
MLDLIADYPFVLAIFAAVIAETSAILLRRIAPFFGQWCWWLSRSLTVIVYLSLSWSFYWAIRQGTDPYAIRRPILVVVGWLGLLLGVGLIVWSVVVLGRRTFIAQSDDKLETRPPYRFLRRPMGLGLIILGLGVVLILDAKSTWTWLLVWLIVSQPLQELEEWELRHRIPGAKDYLRKTPRYIPQFWKRRSSRSS